MCRPFHERRQLRAHRRVLEGWPDLPHRRDRGDGVFGPLKHGKEDLKYRISFGDHETELYLERHEARPMSGEPETLRWWVFAFDRKPKPRRE